MKSCDVARCLRVRSAAAMRVAAAHRLVDLPMLLVEMSHVAEHPDMQVEVAVGQSA